MIDDVNATRTFYPRRRKLLGIGKPLLTLDPAGFVYRNFPRIRWTEVTEMRAIGVQRQPVLLVRLRDEDGFLAGLDGMAAAVATANKRLTGALVVLPPRKFGLPIEKLAAEIEARRQEFGE